MKLFCFFLDVFIAGLRSATVVFAPISHPSAQNSSTFRVFRSFDDSASLPFSTGLSHLPFKEVARLLRKGSYSACPGFPPLSLVGREPPEKPGQFPVLAACSSRQTGN
jgi:hypothetical protein